MGKKEVLLLISPLLGVLLLWAILILALGTTQPFYVVEGESMEPTLSDGDLVMVKKVDPEEVEVGDIIVFYEPGSHSTIIIHRVVYRVEQGGHVFFKTKGDNNRDPDPWFVSEKDLIGVVVGGSEPLKFPLLGRLALFLKTPYGKALVIVLYALFALEVLRGGGERR